MWIRWPSARIGHGEPGSAPPDTHPGVQGSSASVHSKAASTTESTRSRAELARSNHGGPGTALTTMPTAGVAREEERWCGLEREWGGTAMGGPLFECRRSAEGGSGGRRGGEDGELGCRQWSPLSRPLGATRGKLGQFLTMIP
jgi:hypothetical protein